MSTRTTTQKHALSGDTVWLARQLKRLGHKPALTRQAAFAADAILAELRARAEMAMRAVTL